MSFYPIVTKEDLIFFIWLSWTKEKSKSSKSKIRRIKQTDDIKVAENLSRITKKLEEVKQSTQKLGDVINESNYEKENNQKVVAVEIE